MIRLVIGTQNPGKLLELRDLFKGPNYEVMSLKDFKNIPSVKEIGKTFEENAVIKASTLAKQLREVVLADDSGLVVPALKGEPGVHSARYAGDMASDQDNIQKLLQSAKALTGNQRNAYFQCVIAVAKPNGKTLVVEGRVDGKLLHAPRGNFGFGYDPIFLISSLDKSMAELPSDEKANISHRGKATKALLEKLPEFLKD